MLHELDMDWGNKKRASATQRSHRFSTVLGGILSIMIPIRGVGDPNDKNERDPLGVSVEALVMDADQEAAASKIAAAKKGRQARQEVKEKKEAAGKIGAAAQGRRVRKEKQQQDKAATAIQAQRRGRKTRQMRQSGQRYYTPAEVASHNSADDLWVTFFNKVVDLTPLIKDNPGHLVQPLVAAAGTDITHWFDPVTKNVRTYIDSKTELEVPFTPMGQFLHCPPALPTADWSSDIGAPAAPATP